MRKLIAGLLALSAATLAFAQGGNTGLGGDEGDYTSLAQRITGLEKKNDNFNLFLNFAYSYQISASGSDLSSAFRAKHLRLEIKGQFGEHLGYRLRHRLNMGQEARSESFFSKATDIMMVSWKFNDFITVMGGKMCQFWGGFEFDENPMYIYQYSDMLDYMDIFLAGAAVAVYPFKGQEFVLNVTNSYSGKFADEYGARAATAGGTVIKASAHPLTYILNWNGKFWNGLVETRWGVGTYNQAEGFWNMMVLLGQKLNLRRFQVYLDLMSSWEGLDRLRIASSELCRGAYLTDVNYSSVVLKANWQFRPGWNIMTKGMFDTATTPGMSTYREVYGAVGALEYYPMKGQDLRVFIAGVGRYANYNETSGLQATLGGLSGRIELGLIYRIKAY